MKADLPGIDGGKEVASEEGNQGQRDRDHRREREDEYLSMVQSELQRPAVHLAQPLEAPLDPPAHPSDRVAAAGLSSRLFVRKEVADQGGNQGAGEEVRSEHREDDRHRERDEERFRHSGDQRHGKEDDADAERRDERRNRDLRCPVEDGTEHRFAHRVLPVEILHFHGRVVDEDADRERHPAQRHEIDRLPEPIEHDDRDQERKRNGGHHHDRRAPAPQEEQHHDPRETGCDGGFAHDPHHRALHEDRLIGEGLDL